MPLYRVHRLKQSQKEHFRWSAHTGGLAIIKPRDYELGGEVESQTPYSLWKELQDSGLPHHERPLSPGDVLETVEGEGPGRLFIAKYIGFEPAQWFVPETMAVEPVPPSDELVTIPRPGSASQS